MIFLKLPLFNCVSDFTFLKFFAKVHILLKTENYNAEFKKSIYQAYYIFFKLTIYYLLIAPQKLFQKAKIKNME